MTGLSFAHNIMSQNPAIDKQIYLKYIEKMVA